MVDGNGLENRRAGNGTVGSNPTLSAKKRKTHLGLFFLATRLEFEPTVQQALA